MLLLDFLEVKMENDKRIKVLEMIAEDMKNDAKDVDSPCYFDGCPFNEKTVFDSLEDLNPEYLEQADYELAYKIYRILNIRVPSSIISHLSNK